MRALMLGDIVGRSGREAVIRELPRLRKEMRLDFVLVNVDNASGGFGVQPKHCEEIIAAGADVLTGGDHVWDQKEMRGAIDGIPKLLRPANYPDGTAGRGHVLITIAGGRKVLVLHLLGQVFIQDNLDCPFAYADKLLKGHKMGVTADAIFVDIHAEATSEKCGMGWFLDGRVSAVAGSHTHIPTADARVLPGGTGYLTDMGMCGDYQSVIGFQKEAPLAIFTQKMRKLRMEPALGEATLCGLFIETDDRTGLAKQVNAVRIGGALSQA